MTSLAPALLPLQTQRQLQLSLEAHSRYITSLLEQSELKSQLPAGLVNSSSGAAGPQSTAAGDAAPAEQQPQQQQPSPAQQQPQQPQQQPPPAKQQQQQQEQQQQPPDPPLVKPEQPGCNAASTGGATTAGTGSHTGFNAASSVATVSMPALHAAGSSLQPPSPGTLLHRDIGGAAAAWDAVDAAALRKLQAAGAGEDGGPKRQRVG